MARRAPNWEIQSWRTACPPTRSSDPRVSGDGPCRPHQRWSVRQDVRDDAGVGGDQQEVAVVAAYPVVAARRRVQACRVPIRDHVAPAKVGRWHATALSVPATAGALPGHPRAMLDVVVALGTGATAAGRRLIGLRENGAARRQRRIVGLGYTVVLFHALRLAERRHQ